MAIKKSGLGKGLDSMFPKYDTGKSSEPASGTKAKQKKAAPVKEEKKDIQTLRLSEIEPNRDQPRKQFDEDGIQELADSIKQYGLIQPLVVQKRDGYYEIIAGERRWRAAKIAGLKEVPVVIKDFSNQEIVEISLIENIQREDLNPIEEAMAYQRLIDEFHLKQDEIADKVSKSRTTITNSLRLLKLDDRVQEMLAGGLISTGHARALLAIGDRDRQAEAARKIFDEQLSVREVEKLVKQMTGPEPVKKEAPAGNAALDLIYQDMADHMKSILGTKVTVRRKTAKKGRIEIEYYSAEELERIFELLKSIGNQS